MREDGPQAAPAFDLRDGVIPAARAQLDRDGFVLFRGVIRAPEIAVLMAELDRLNTEWAAARKQSHFGIPIVWGRDPMGRPYVQRFCFTSLFSRPWHDLIHDPRLRPIASLLGDTVRIGEREKDGVVVNRYLNGPGSAVPALGWHTDGLRDVFYGRRPRRMLNVGIHFDRCTAADGGLRLLPGTHRQGLWGTCLRKPYFVAHAPDPAELAIETEAGDVTVHDGRLWHRVARSPHTGFASLRRTMYVPYLTDPVVMEKDEHSPTPLYHRAGVLLRRFGLLAA